MNAAADKPAAPHLRQLAGLGGRLRPGLGGFWQWWTRFASLISLGWLRDSNEPLYNVMYEIRFNVRDTPAHLREAERWKVPNKLTDRSRG